MFVETVPMEESFTKNVTRDPVATRRSTIHFAASTATDEVARE
jgi:hypothetical protein